MKELNGESDNIIERNFAELARIFPEAISENKIKWDELKATLGEEIAKPDDRYGLNWKGKPDVFAAIQQRTSKTLKPDLENSKSPKDTQNMFIEGDNLEALKILHKAYYGKVKMIYIDPPYNTGNDFVYNDKFAKNRRDYLAETGEIDDEGFATGTDGLRKNSRDNGHFHSNWLNMMYPRLYLARNLLRADGVIFVSIDDNEVANLRLIMDEIFGAENFVAQIVWERAYAPVNLKHHFSESHDYILCYARSIDNLDKLSVSRSDAADARYKNPDNDPRGVWQSDNFSVGPANPKNIYEIITPGGRKVLPPSGYSWRFSEERTKELIADNRVSFGESGENVPRLKRFLSEVKDGITPMTIWKYKDVGHSQDATKEVKDLFDGKAFFDYPKPTKLIKRLLGLATSDDDIILDFFAGSGTTAQAVMELNAEDGGNRKWILVQLPEETDEKSEACKAGYATVADIATERIRRAGAKIGKGDAGFKLYKVSASNFKKWNEHPTDADKLRQQTLDHLNPLVDDVNDGDLLVELLLKNGISPLDEIENHGEWYFAPSPNLAICLSRNITTELFGKILLANPAKVILLDLGFNDDSQLKANILLQAGEKDVEVEVA